MAKRKKKKVTARPRPLKDAGEWVTYVCQKVTKIIEGYEKAGEVQVVIDVLKFKAIATLHIPLPPLKKLGK